jgi:hypothetical protein
MSKVFGPFSQDFGDLVLGPNWEAIESEAAAGPWWRGHLAGLVNLSIHGNGPDSWRVHAEGGAGYPHKRNQLELTCSATCSLDDAKSLAVEMGRDLITRALQLFETSPMGAAPLQQATGASCAKQNAAAQRPPSDGGQP